MDIIYIIDPDIYINTDNMHIPLDDDLDLV